MSSVIQVENLSKAYQIGEFSTGTLSQDIERWWLRIRGKEDKFLMIGEENDRTVKGEGNMVWSLKDINFDIKRGEAVGIIGRNGAGKSTLLKILSRVTTPTTGSVKVKGRIASLLEVGTGFHPELTGRENIFLNGAILGMRKQETKRKFDEIVDFSGVERYIDTPVKRYSSGMYVRLAFAVAAHLESEILIIDEVLAVGDGEFQKKCLGKMDAVSKGEGRTILFVSHNMNAISTLTVSSLLLVNGTLVANSSTTEVIKEYLEYEKASKGIFIKKSNEQLPSITRVEVITSEPASVHSSGKSLDVLIEVNMPSYVEGMGLSFQIINENEVEAVYSYVFDVDKPLLRKKGLNKLRCRLPNCSLYVGKYYLKLYLAESKGRTLFDNIDKVCEFEVQILDRSIEWGWQKNLCVYMEQFNWIQE